MGKRGQHDHGPAGDEPGGPPGRFGDDLVGLDPDDPEAKAFAAHLDRMEHSGSKATVEGMLEGVEDFAHQARNARGPRRTVAVAVVVLILFGVGYTVWNALVFMLQTFLG